MLDAGRPPSTALELLSTGNATGSAAKSGSGGDSTKWYPQSVPSGIGPAATFSASTASDAIEQRRHGRTYFKRVKRFWRWNHCFRWSVDSRRGVVAAGRIELDDRQRRRTWCGLRTACGLTNDRYAIEPSARSGAGCLGNACHRGVCRSNQSRQRPAANRRGVLRHYVGG